MKNVYCELCKDEYLSLAFYFYFVVKILEFCEKDSVFPVVDTHLYASLLTISIHERQSFGEKNKGKKKKRIASEVDKDLICIGFRCFKEKTGCAF